MNTHYPGLPDYVGPTQGWFLLLHHNIVAEWSEDIRERVRYISAHKPPAEREIRLRCLYAVEADRVPLAYRQAVAAYNQTHAAYNQSATAYRQAAAAWEQARTAYWQAEVAVRQAEVAHAPELTALIRACVPDAPWDGTHLVFEAEGAP